MNEDPRKKTAKIPIFNSGYLPIGILISFTIVFLIALGPYLRMHDLVTLGLIPLLTVIGILHQSKNTILDLPIEFIVFLLLFISGLSSAYYFTDHSRFITGLSGFFGALLAAYISVSLNKRNDYGIYFHIGYILSILILILIMNMSGNFSFSNFASKIDFRNRFLLNANAYSYFSYFANFSILFLYIKYRTKFIRFLAIILPILFIVIAFVTQSRSGLFFIILVNACYWYLIDVPLKKNRHNKLLRYVVLIVATIFLLFQFISIYQNSRIKGRIENSVVQGDSRGNLIEQSFEIFTDHPFFGVGLGQLTIYTTTKQFSHNSYLEVLAEQGVFGGILLTILFVIPLRKCVLLRKSFPDDQNLRLILLFFISFYIYNNAYPFYKFPFSMLYFFFVISLQNSIWEKHIRS